MNEGPDNNLAMNSALALLLVGSLLIIASIIGACKSFDGGGVSIGFEYHSESEKGPLGAAPRSLSTQSAPVGHAGGSHARADSEALWNYLGVGGGGGASVALAWFLARRRRLRRA